MENASPPNFRFDHFHVVPKLNSGRLHAVQSAIGIVRSVASSIGGITEVSASDITPTTLIVAIGGDGTMLQAMRLAAQSNATSVGINLGRIGFLAEIDAQRHLSHAIAAVMLHGWDTFADERVLLQTSVSDTLACNEISVSGHLADSLITYRLTIGHQSAGVHRANGLLLSTPTGSTAYSLSVGGALMMPEMEAVQIIPVAPATLTSRPIIVPAGTRITLQAWGNDITVRADGQVIKSSEDSHRHAPSESYPFILDIKAYENKAKILHFNGWNFFDVLTEKLGWKHE